MLADPVLREELEAELLTRLKNRPLSRDEMELLNAAHAAYDSDEAPAWSRLPPQASKDFISEKFGPVSLATEDGRRLLGADPELRAEVDEFLASLPPSPPVARSAAPPAERHDPNESIESIVARMGGEHLLIGDGEDDASARGKRGR